MTKTSIVFTVFVILCLFASNSEAKHFCDSFQENGYKIDYTLEYCPFKPITGGEWSPIWIPRDLLVVIGSDYWVIKMNIDVRQRIDSMEFKSNESRPHNLGAQYSAAFLLRAWNGNKTNTVGFIRKNQRKIEWKVLTLLEDNCPLDNCIQFESINENTQLSLPDGFIPSATFVLFRKDEGTKYFAFVEQKPDSNDSSLFTRRYITKGVKGDQLPDLTSESVYTQIFTQKNDLIIGTMIQWDQGWDSPPIVYSRKRDILFCTLKGFHSVNPVNTNAMFDITFNECSDRQIVIQCPFVPQKPEESNAIYWVIVAIIAIVIVVIICCFLCYQYYRTDNESEHSFFSPLRRKGIIKKDSKTGGMVPGPAITKALKKSPKK